MEKNIGKLFKVSITVPVYNTSKYLRKCLDSLANQTLKDIECIIVDDGSTDESVTICDEYAKKYEHFKVFHQENGGLASARQTGLEAAIGEYIIVCDSDDWVEPNMYEKLYRTAKDTNADIVLCNYFAEYTDGRSEPRNMKFKELDGLVDIRNMLLIRPGASWIKLIRKSLFENGRADFHRGINMGEDVLMMYKLAQQKPKIVQIDDNLYHYRRLMGEGSYTNSPSMKQLAQMIYIYEWLKTQPDYQKDEELLYGRVTNIIFAALRSKDLDEKYLKDLLSAEVSWKRIMTNRLTSKSVITGIAKLLPVSFVRQLVKRLYPYFYK